MAAINVENDIDVGNTMSLLFGTIDFDASYPTGGEVLDVTGRGNVRYLFAEPKGGYTFQWDDANQKLIARQGDNANAAAAPGIEVPNATNLSTLTGVKYFALVDN